MHCLHFGLLSLQDGNDIYVRVKRGKQDIVFLSLIYFCLSLFGWAVGYVLPLYVCTLQSVLKGHVKKEKHFLDVAFIWDCYVYLLCLLFLVHNHDVWLVCQYSFNVSIEKSHWIIALIRSSHSQPPIVASPIWTWETPVRTPCRCSCTLSRQLGCAAQFLLFLFLCTLPLCSGLFLGPLCSAYTIAIAWYDVSLLLMTWCSVPFLVLL